MTLADTATIINTQDWYSLADTALKIGLGALISGITTYYITKTNQKHDFSKEKFNQKIIMLNTATTEMEKYFNAVHKLIDYWYAISLKQIATIDNLNESDLTELLIRDKNYLNSIENVTYAISNFQILGINDIPQTIMSYDTSIIKTRNVLMTKRNITFADKEVMTFMQEQNILKENIYKKINIYFEKL